MCGIVGFFSNQSVGEKKGLLENMIGALAHRGPDGYGIYISKKIAIGHSRLSIIDPMGGQQPFVTDRYVVSFNGELYNYIELREYLQGEGIKFHTASDTEVVVKMLEFYGESAFEHFNGQFALLLWDKVSSTLLVSRDRFGIRPLYVLSYNKTVYFASEMKAFDYIEGFDRTINVDNLLEHGMLWNTLADRTVYNSIRSVESGTYEIYIDGKLEKVRRYYQIGENTSRSPRSFMEAKEEFSSLLEESVKLRLRSDVPVGTYLSGGIDSSVISYLTAKANTKRCDAFSLSFENSDFDESSYHELMAKDIGVERHVRRITDDDICNSFLDTVYHCERPLFRTAPAPLYHLSNLVRKHGTKVVLTGEAADEILYGYDSYKELKIFDFWDKNRASHFRPLLIRRLYPHLRHFRDERQFGLMRMFYEGFLDSYKNELAGLNIRSSNNSILIKYINKERNIAPVNLDLIEKVKNVLPVNCSSWTLLQRNQFLEMKTLLSGYLLSSQGDRMSLAHGVEGRYPFLDHRLVDAVFNYEDSYKLHIFAQKYLLRESFRGLIPEKIIDREKMPYQAPDIKAFFSTGNLYEQGQFFLKDEMIKEFGIFDTKMVDRFIKKFSQNVPETVGYRDNMIISFILSTQMAQWWAKNPKRISLSEYQKTVEIIE